MADLTVGMLRALLEDLDEDTPVRMGYQRSYPLAAHIQHEVRLFRNCAWILEADQVYDAPYLPKWLLDGEEEPCGCCGDRRRSSVASVLHGGEASVICQICLDALTPEDLAEARITPF